MTTTTTEATRPTFSLIVPQGLEKRAMRSTIFVEPGELSIMRGSSGRLDGSGTLEGIQKLVDRVRTWCVYVTCDVTMPDGQEIFV